MRVARIFGSGEIAGAPEQQRAQETNHKKELEGLKKEAKRF